jgi:hypothetical protein
VRRFLHPLLIAAALAGSSCSRDPSAPAVPAANVPFEGAKPLELACVKERRPATRAELEQLVRALVEVAGGESALRRVTFRKVEDLYLRRSGDPDSNHVLVTTTVRGADLSLRTLLEYHSGQVEQRVFWNKQEYICARGQQLAVAMGGNKQYVEWDFEVARMPLWLADASALTPLPLRVLDGRVLVGMHAEVEGWNPAFDCYVDPAGPMVVTLEAVLPITGDLVIRTSATQRVLFSDFRRVNGLLFPFRRDLELDGKRFALAEVRTLETGLELDVKDFMPGGIPPEADVK